MQVILQHGMDLHARPMQVILQHSMDLHASPMQADQLSTITHFLACAKKVQRTHDVRSYRRCCMQRNAQQTRNTY